MKKFLSFSVFPLFLLSVLLNAPLYSITGCVSADIISSCTAPGHFAFTFDQGPSPNTGLLLNILAKHKIKATFHVTAAYLNDPVILAYLRKTAADGHLIGLAISETAASSVSSYIAEMSARLKPYIGYAPTYLRFPAPGPSADIVDSLTSSGFKLTTYNLDSQDYAFPNDNDPNGGIFQIFKRTLDQILPPALGAFISVQRDILESSVIQTDAIAAYVIEKGYKPVRLDACIGNPTELPGPPKPGGGSGSGAGGGKGSGGSDAGTGSTGGGYNDDDTKTISAKASAIQSVNAWNAMMMAMGVSVMIVVLANVMH